jgi:hypothetical protein
MAATWTAWLLAMAIIVCIKNTYWHLEHENYEGVAKWATLTLLFIFSLLLSLFA